MAVKKIEDKETRYYIDLDLKKGVIIGWDYGQRENLSQELDDPAHHRIFLSKGQYHKLDKKKSGSAGAR